MTTYSDFIIIPFIIATAFFLTLSIMSFWLIVYYLIRNRKSTVVLYLILIIIIFVFSILNIHLFFLRYPKVGLLFQIAIVFPTFYVFWTMSARYKLPERTYRIKISVAFLSSIILLMQPIAYASYLKVIDHVNHVRLDRSEKKVRYIMNYEKEHLLEVDNKIKNDQKLIAFVSQKNLDAINNYIDEKKKLEGLDIFIIRIPNLNEINGIDLQTNHLSILGTSAVQPEVKLEPLEIEHYNFVIKSYIYDDTMHTIGEIILGRTLNTNYFDSLKPYFLSNFLILNKHGIYYKSDESISLPYSFNFYDLEHTHNQIVNSQTVPNLVLSLPIDDKSPNEGSIVFETTAPQFMQLAQAVAVAQVLLALNIVAIYIFLERKEKSEYKDNDEKDLQ